MRQRNDTCQGIRRNLVFIEAYGGTLPSAYKKGDSQKYSAIPTTPERGEAGNLTLSIPSPFCFISAVTRVALPPLQKKATAPSVVAPKIRFASALLVLYFYGTPLRVASQVKGKLADERRTARKS